MTFKKILFLTIIISVTSLLFLRSDLQASENKTKPRGLNFYVSRDSFRSDVYNIGPGSVYFYEEQPIPFELSLENVSSNIIDIGRDDWYNAITDFYVVPERKLTEKEMSERLSVTPESFRAHVRSTARIAEKERKVRYKIIKSEDLTGGKLNPGEAKIAIVEVLDENNQLYEAGYFYRFIVKLSFDNFVVSGMSDGYWLEKITTSKEYEKAWTYRQGEKAMRDGKFEESAKQYQILLELDASLTEKDRAKFIYPRSQNIRRDLADAYVKAGNYTKAKEVMYQSLDFVNQDIENRISRAREKASEKGIEFNREDYLKADKKKSHYDKTKKDEMFSDYSISKPARVSPYYYRDAILYIIKKYETMETADNYAKAKEYKKAKEVLIRELKRYNKYLEKRLVPAREMSKKEGRKFEKEKFIKRDKRSFLNQNMYPFFTSKNLLPLTPYDERDILLEKIKVCDELMKNE